VSAPLALIAGLALALLGVMFMPICFALTGDEMPGWLEDWAPLVSVVLALTGGITIVVAVVLIFGQAL
jgi:hypothetical protein